MFKVAYGRKSCLLQKVHYLIDVLSRIPEAVAVCVLTLLRRGGSHLALSPASSLLQPLLSGTSLLSIPMGCNHWSLGHMTRMPSSDWPMISGDRKSTRLNSSHVRTSRMPSSA